LRVHERNEKAAASHFLVLKAQLRLWNLGVNIWSKNLIIEWEIFLIG
jgi:hypothetical protein